MLTYDWRYVVTIFDAEIKSSRTLLVFSIVDAASGACLKCFEEDASPPSMKDVKSYLKDHAPVRKIMGRC